MVNERLSTYTVDDGQMAAGSTIGSPTAVIALKANGAFEKFYSVAAGATLASGLQVRFWDARTGVALDRHPGRFVIHPDRQDHEYALSNGILVREIAFVLNGTPQRHRPDPAIAYLQVTITNPNDFAVTLASYAAVDLRGETSGDLRVRYDDTLGCFIAYNPGDRRFARAFGTSQRPTSWEATTDHGKFSRPDFPGTLGCRVIRDAPVCVALIHHHHRLEPNSSARATFVLGAAERGTRELRRIYAGAPAFDAALRRTRARYDGILRRAIVMTPDRYVNHGVLWAKANMLRTQLHTQTGWCFVNDPARSNNSVGRDTAWFSFGSDYVTPDFSRESLLWYVEHLRRRGMVAEYYDVRTGKAEDYGLNVNDDTPLIVLAIWHHYNATGDRAFLQRAYLGCRRAARYLLSQRDARGLVWCTATATGAYGIAGWRNVIPGYRLSGATTELNSECYAALQAVSKMAAALGRRIDREWFARRAEELRAAINQHLVNPETGLYYLNIDVDGSKRTDVTCDLVFPVMFGVADDERAAHIVSRLSMEPFWTPAGIRTVPRDDIGYGPARGYGLRGGVWVGVTFWYAFAAARFNPALMASALRDSFRHYSRDPRRNNTVPGQFSEWLHGETLANRGMMLSPWFPPRYLWAAIEGAAGLDLSGDQPTCNPRLAPDWRWLGVRNLRFRGGFVSWFVVRSPDLSMYATFRFAGSAKYEAYDRDVTDELLDVAHEDAIAIALQREDAIVLLVGNTADRTIVTSLQFKQRLRGSFGMRAFSSQRGAWLERTVSGRDLFRGIPIQIDSYGFAVLELQGRVPVTDRVTNPR